MTDAQRRRAEELFHQIVELPLEQRESCLAATIDVEPEVRDEVESLLAHDEKTVTTLDVSQPSADEADLVGKRVGPYKVLQLIGEGGFGSVYMAEQEEPLRRKVALKIIKLGMDTKQVIARFEAERHALALMEHPGIAKVLDAGATEAGRPYFVMELVRGVPITEYADERRLSTRDRLQLMVEVCRAVQHAHQKGIIHRDLKPSNVLVTIQDGRPVPKVIDFGIAKATKQRLTELTLFTEFRQFIGTPQYMSPEQAEMSGLDIDTRSDIYSLGVVLYELLTGTTPFDAQRFRSASYAEIQRIIREEECTRPSSRLSQLGPRLESAARCRRAEPDVLRRLVRGDLDCITMKALEKDRTQRYGTAADLAADLERHLNHEPVLAGPPRTAYKLMKFVRRHRVGVVTGGLMVLALVAGFTLATAGFVQASAQRDAADESAARARAISQFFQEMLAAADPLQLRQLSAFATDETLLPPPTGGGLARDVSVAQMVRRAAQRIGVAFEGRPVLEATARETVGMTLRGLGLYAEADPELRTALALRQGALGEHHPDTLRSAVELGALLLDSGHGAEALKLIRGAYEGMIRTYGPENPRTLSCGTIWATALADQNDFSSAELRFFDTLEAQRRVLGPEHRDTLVTMWNWAVVDLMQWKLRDGEARAKEVYEIAARTLAPDDSLNVLSKPLMGWSYLAQHRYADAEAVLRPGLEQCEHILGPAHPFTYLTMHGLARTLQGREAQGEKERLHRAALAGLRATRGPLHRHTMATLSDLARWLAEKGEFEEAGGLCQELVEDCTACFGGDADATLSALRALADLLERRGRLDESVALRQERLARLQKRGGPVQIETLQELDALAHGLLRIGKVDAARDVTRSLLERTRALAEQKPDAALAVNNYAWFLLICVPADMRDPATALPLARRAAELTQYRSPPVLDTLALACHLSGDNEQAIEIQRQSLALLPPQMARDINYGANLVRYLLQQGDQAAADQYVRQGIELFRTARGPDDPLLALQFNKAGIALDEAGQYAMAEAVLRESLTLNEKLLGAEHEQVAESLRLLATVYTHWDKYDQAAKCYQRALEIQRALLGDDHLVVADHLHALGVALRMAGRLSAARAALDEAAEIYTHLELSHIPEALALQSDRAETLLASGRAADADALAVSALGGLRPLFGDDHPDTVHALQIVGLVRVEQGRAAEAEPLLRTCAATAARLHGEPHEQWQVANADAALGYCLSRLGRYAEAESLLLTSYETLCRDKGDAFAGTRQAIQRLVSLYEAWGKARDADQWRVRATRPGSCCAAA